MNAPVPCRVTADLRAYEASLPREYTQAEENLLDKRADALMAERIANADTYKDFAADARSQTADEQIHRALMNLDRACNGDEIAVGGITASLHIVQKIYKAWCEATFREECRGEAEHEYSEGDL